MTAAEFSQTHAGQETRGAKRLDGDALRAVYVAPDRRQTGCLGLV